MYLQICLNVLKYIYKFLGVDYVKALVTGASSGIGRDIACELSKMGYDIYAVARRENKLLELKESLKTNIYPIVADLSNRQECIALYDKLKNEDIEIVVNNAGFGAFGDFLNIPLEREIEMIDTNIVSLHILTKLFLKDFKKKNKGYILNVASSAGFMMGPLLATYYASKAYVLRITEAIYRELKETHSAVHVCALCPGPVKTEFDDVANVKFSIKGLESSYVAKYAVKKMFKRKMLIIPGFIMKLSLFFSRLVPDSLLSKITYSVQRKKDSN